MSRKRTEPSTIDLLLRLPKQATALIKAEYANAKTEVKSASKKLIIGIIFVVIALFFLFWAVAAFGASAILGLANAMSPWLAALLVAVGLVVLTAVSILVGYLLIKRGNPVPEATLDRVGDDMAVASSIKYNTDPDARIHDASPRVADRTAGSKRGEGK